MHTATAQPKRRRIFLKAGAVDGALETILDVGGPLEAVRLAHSLIVAAAELATELKNGDEK